MLILHCKNSERVVSMRKNICIIGPLGAGKSTCTSLLSNDNYISISSGKLIRATGMNIADGNLINDQAVVSLIYTEMQKSTKSVIHDGFPRTAEQGLQFMKLGEHIDLVFYLNLSYETLIHRVSNRLVCSNPLCQTTYNRNTTVSDNGKYYCKHCHSILTVRQDDNPYAIQKRYNIFQQHLNDIINFCHTYNIPFIEIDAQKPSLDICKEITSHLK